MLVWRRRPFGNEDHRPPKYSLLVSEIDIYDICMISQMKAIMIEHYHAADVLQYEPEYSSAILKEILLRALEREAGVQPPSFIHHTSLFRLMSVHGIIDPTFTQLVWPTGLNFENLQKRIDKFTMIL